MDYQALGLGDAASVVTAVTVDTDDQSILLSCLYNPQQAPMSYTLWFRQCENIAWDTFGDVPDLQHLEAELVGLSHSERTRRKSWLSLLQTCLNSPSAMAAFPYKRLPQAHLSPHLTIRSTRPRPASDSD